MAGALDSTCHFSLVAGASASLAAGANFPLFRNETAQHINLLVINFQIFIRTELADLWAGNVPATTLELFVLVC